MIDNNLPKVLIVSRGVWDDSLGTSSTLSNLFSKYDSDKAMGLPCITTNISGCNEIVIQGENGEIIPPRDEKALYEKMKDWVVHKDKLAYMSSHARSFVENRFDKKTVWLKLLEEYNRLLTS